MFYTDKIGIAHTLQNAPSHFLQHNYKLTKQKSPHKKVRAHVINSSLNLASN
jgi:hypothetical protein